MNIQIKPATKTNFRIFVLCDQKELNSNFDINKNCFQIAIFFANNNIDDMKNRIIKYLLLPSSFKKPTIYLFKNNGFVKLSNLDEIGNVNKPIFAAWENPKFIQVKSHITSHIVESNI